MAKPLALTDQQFAAVYQACAALAPSDRDGFLRALADRLGGEPELGDGVVGRAIRELQREFFRAPAVEKYPARHDRRRVGEPLA